MKKLYPLKGTLSRILLIPLPFTLSFLCCFLFTIAGYTQVNSYAKVTAIATVAGKSDLTLANINQVYHTFAVGEQVIVIQMQDNIISGTGNNASFGLLSAIANTGLYEVATINALTAGTMTLNDVLSNAYTIGSNSSVQVVSFAQLSAGNYTTSSNITAVTWNGSSGTGGVAAFQVPGTLTLQHSITADGQGFAGGAASGNNIGLCAASTYSSSSTNYGAKGEGIYLINTVSDPTYVRGRARVLSGGGGGSFIGGGGAGGSNFTAGGNGATSFLCGTTVGGLGGIALNTYLLAGTRLFLGGGGGGGQGNGSQTAGANGGGIIIIKAGTLTTNCGSSVRISANGNNAANAGHDGAGGGGAAGTVLLEISTYSVPVGCALTIQAQGGNGGDAGSAVSYGAGGGGGQGALIFTGTLPVTNITNTTTPGNGGSTDWFGGNASNGAGSNNAGIISGIGVVLPVRLIYFSAENKNNKAVLYWTSADESNVTYNIERSTDGINFLAIGTVKGNGQTNYTFTDPSPVNGRIYYRLVMTGNLTAKTMYSSLVNVGLSEALQMAIAYPNPAHDHFYIRIQGENNSKVYAVTITDLTGQVVYTTTGKATNNILTVTPNRALKPGLYMFTIISDGNEQTGKLMIQ
jgi:type IX secretion system substrate protein